MAKIESTGDYRHGRFQAWLKQFRCATNFFWNGGKFVSLLSNGVSTAPFEVSLEQLDLQRLDNF